MKINQLKKNLNNIWAMLLLSVSFLLIWCSNSVNSNWFDIEIEWFNVNYNGSVKLEEIAISNDDMEEISQLYQEVSENESYKDSLLVAEKYSRWLWINTFVQENLDTLEAQWLTLKNITKKQLTINKNNAVLVNYEITAWLIPEVPKLYICELFISKDSNIILFSYITEKQSANKDISKIFQNIKYK